MAEWRLLAREAGKDDRPIRFVADDDGPSSLLLDALEGVGFENGDVFVDGEPWRPGDDDTLERSMLRHGSVLTTAPSKPTAIDDGLFLVALTGTDAGASLRLEPGAAKTVGRSDAHHLALQDPAASSDHFTIRLVDGVSAEVVNRSTSVGTWFEGNKLDQFTMRVGDFVKAGATLFELVAVDSASRAVDLGPTTTGVSIQRQFRRRERDLRSLDERPEEPVERSTSTTPVWRSLMPLLSGVGFAIMFNRWEFLLITAIAPLVYAWDNRRRKKRAQEEFIDETARYQTALDDFVRDRGQLLHEEAKRRRAASPSGGTAAFHASVGHVRLWERSPDDADFGSVTVGQANLAAEAVAAERGEDDRTLWSVPLLVNLLSDGPLHVGADLAASRGVARSLIIDLASAHSPGDVQLSVLGRDGSEKDWRFARWLPHTFDVDGDARVAVTPEGRAAVIRRLRAVISQREEDGGQTALPLHVFVLDEAHAISRDDLNDLLTDGRRVGVVGIVIDQRPPEGVRTSITLGEHPDEAELSSSTLTPASDVSVAILSEPLANESALALAPLETSSAGARRPVGRLYFTDLVDAARGGSKDVTRLWEAASPRMSVPVGRTMDGAAISMDLVEQGPHGLIGGKTRSGKTEFLKTLFASLALHNTPDDLAFVVVDFKGGVDYDVLGELPHFIEVATNQAADRFERTVELVAAELGRRQREFGARRAQNLDAYRAQRAADPSIPPMPRLLVVADEFSLLVKSEVGKAQMGRLEELAVAGAAFGMHLLLVTQTFQNQLSPQLEGQTGFRVCCKVESTADSKLVIKSGAAERISVTTPGRAFARLAEGEPVEFQSARVGNRRRDIGGEVRKATAADSPLATIAIPIKAPKDPEVPSEEQDLRLVVDLIKAAWPAHEHTPAIPWPLPLPEAIDLADLEQIPGVPAMIGRTDDPRSQEQGFLRFDFDQSVVALGGSDTAGQHDALVTIGLATALASHPDELHLYGVDLMGVGLASLSALPHAGTIAVRDEETARRLLAFLNEESERRRALFAGAGVTSFADYQRRADESLPQLLLLVAGLDQLQIAAESTTSAVRAPLKRLIDEVAGTGIIVCMSGSVSSLAATIGSSAGRKLFFGASDPAEYPSTVDRAVRKELGQRLRCFDTQTGLVAQVAELVADDVAAGDVISEIGALVAGRAGEVRRPPQRHRRAAWPLLYQGGTVLDGAAPPPSYIVDPLPLGFDPSSAEIVWLDPEEDGASLRVLGPRKSGRSNAIASIALMASRFGWDPVICAPSQRSPLHRMQEVAGYLHPLKDFEQEVAIRRQQGKVLALVDDAHRILEDVEWERVRASAGALIVAGTTDDLAKSAVIRALDAQGGIVLKPSRARDANEVGATADEDWVLNPRSGIGVAGIAGETRRVQQPLVVPDE